MHDDDARAKAPAAVKKIEKELREHGLTYPETTEDFPWGHSAIKVKGKAFAFISLHADEVSISMKLPHSRDMASDLPFTEPTGYGMAKYGWITSHLRPKDKPPLDLIKSWMDESYRAIAPKKLVAAMDGAPATKSGKTKASKPSKAARKRKV